MKRIILILTIILEISIIGNGQNKNWVNETKFKRPKSFTSANAITSYNFSTNKISYDLRITTPVIKGLNLGAGVGLSSLNNHSITNFSGIADWIVLHNYNISAYLSTSLNYHLDKPQPLNESTSIHHKLSTEMGWGIQYQKLPFAFFFEYRYNIVRDEARALLGLKYNLNAKRLGKFRDIPATTF